MNDNNLVTFKDKEMNSKLLPYEFNHSQDDRQWTITHATKGLNNKLDLECYYERRKRLQLLRISPIEKIYIALQSTQRFCSL